MTSAHGARRFAALAGAGGLAAALAASPAPAATRRDARIASGEVRLAATLDLPGGPGPHPVVVLTHASGEGERSFVAYRHLAELLPAGGIAVARYDRRGSGASSGDFVTADFEDLADDASAVLAWARAQPEIDPERAGVWGLSQGGWIAPLVAARDPSLAFVVVVSAAGGTPGEQMIFAAGVALREAGFGDAAVAAAERLRRGLDAFYRGEASREETERLLAGARSQPWFDHAAVPPALPPRVEETKWFHQFDFDPAPAIGALRAPVLLLLAERDPWIPLDDSERIWRTLCRSELTVVRVAGANHFMAATVDPARDLDAEPVSEAYSRALVTWLAARLAPPAAPR